MSAPGAAAERDVRLVSRRFFAGLDLGQSSDPTALAIIEHIVRARWPNFGPEPEYRLRYIKRFPLGTPYTEIVDQVRQIVSHAELRTPGYGEPVLVIDLSGVGRPVLDLMRERGMTPWAISITGGNTVTRPTNDAKVLNVPKRDLATNLQVVVQAKLLKFADGLPDFAALKKELSNFSLKVSKSGQDTYEALRGGQHDDMVLAVALACWLAHAGEANGIVIRAKRGKVLAGPKTKWRA